MEEILYAVVMMLLLGRFFGILVQRIGLNALVGEVIAGVLMGPLALLLTNNVYGITPNDSLYVLSEFGILMLMFLSGLTTDFRSFKKERITSIVVASGGVSVSFVLIFTLLYLAYPKQITSILFVSVILSNTAIEISSRLLMEESNQRLRAVVIGASFTDDIFAVYMIGIVSSIVFLKRPLSLEDIFWLSIKVFIFLSIALTVGDKIFGYFSSKIDIPKEKITLTLSLITAFLMAVIARQMGLHEVIGAYIAGLVVGKWYSEPDPLLRKAILHRKLLADIDAPLRAIFAPLFFVYIGLSLPLKSATNITWIVLLVSAVFVAAILGKIIGCGLTSKLFNFDRGESLLIGVSMCGRGAMELVLMSYGLTSGILTEELFLSLVLIILLTTLATPIMYLCIKKHYMVRR